MRQVTDKETGNTLTVTDQWLAKHRRLVTTKTTGSAEKPKAPRKRASGATEAATAVKKKSALPDTNE